MTTLAKAIPTRPDSPARQVLKFPAKYLRAVVIDRYVREAGYRGIVVFTCGNSAVALRQRASLPVIEIGREGVLSPNRWFTPAEIHAMWPEHFDATSGHLPYPLMLDVAQEFKSHFLYEPKELRPSVEYVVPTGSGETIVCLGMAYPKYTFIAQYDDRKEETRFDDKAPLNKIVAANFTAERLGAAA